MLREFERRAMVRIAVYLDLLDAHAGIGLDVLDVLRGRQHESGLRCRHHRHIIHVRARGAPFEYVRVQNTVYSGVPYRVQSAQHPQ